MGEIDQGDGVEIGVDVGIVASGPGNQEVTCREFITRDNSMFIN